MTVESFWNDIESLWNKSQLPEKLEWISYKTDFVDIYKNIKSRYWEDFSDGDIKLIKDSRAFSCAEYKWNFNNTKKSIAANRIDSALFRANYTKFSNLDKKFIMGTIPNAYTQRKFREIIIKLEKQFGELYSSEVNKVEQRLQGEIRKQPRSDSPIFEKIYGDLSQVIADGRDGSLEQHWLDNDIDNPDYIPENSDQVIVDKWNERRNAPWRIPKDEIEYMINIPIQKEFQDMKDTVFSCINFENLTYSVSNDEWDEWNKWNVEEKKLDENKINYLKKYTNAIFNDFAIQINDYGNWNIPDSFFSNPDTIEIILEYMQDIIDWKEVSAKNLIKQIEEELYNYDEFLWSISIDIAKQTDEMLKDIDEEELEKIVVTEDEINEIKVTIHGENSQEKIDNLIKAYRLYKYLKQKKADLWELDENQKKFLERLENIFANIKKRVLREISGDINRSHHHEFHRKSINIHSEQTTWSIKDINPIAIVHNNEEIYEYVYWNIQHREHLGIKRYEDLETEDRIRLFTKLKEQKQEQWDFAFLESIKYLNPDWSINQTLIGLSWNENIIKENQQKIIAMINDLAIQESEEKCDKDTIKDINVRKSTMVCCFRAISNFFNTVNNNSENLANEFKIDDINKNIEFDQESGVISMEWVIWPNESHIKLYYDTKHWTLSFDNFLAYDDNDHEFKIWKWNWQKERLNIQLPTMDKMEEAANSIAVNLVDNLPLNKRQYNRMVWFTMTESIRFNCFQWFMWVNMEVNQQFVSQFTENNILKQDIIKTIYSKFYNGSEIDEKLSGCLHISEGNQPEQFKLIKLISDSINHCHSADKLLRFRLYVNELDEILTTNHELVEKDALLKYLFVDDTTDQRDSSDISEEIMQRENPELSVSNPNAINNYNTINNSNDIVTNKYNQKYWNQWSELLNYYIFLDLLAEDKWDQRIINLDEFGNALNNIKTSNRNLLNNASMLFEQNYRERYPDIFDKLFDPQFENAYNWG